MNTEIKIHKDQMQNLATKLKEQIDALLSSLGACTYPQICQCQNTLAEIGSELYKIQELEDR